MYSLEKQTDSGTEGTAESNAKTAQTAHLYTSATPGTPPPSF